MCFGTIWLVIKQEVLSHSLVMTLQEIANTFCKKFTIEGSLLFISWPFWPVIEFCRGIVTIYILSKRDKDQINFLSVQKRTSLPLRPVFKKKMGESKSLKTCQTNYMVNYLLSAKYYFLEMQLLFSVSRVSIAIIGFVMKKKGKRPVIFKQCFEIHAYISTRDEQKLSRDIKCKRRCFPSVQLMHVL